MTVITSSSIDESKSWLKRFKRDSKPRIKLLKLKVNGVKTLIWQCADGINEAGVGWSAADSYKSYKKIMESK